MNAPEPSENLPARALARAASAAKALAGAFAPEEPSSSSSLRRDLARDLALGLGRRLEAFAGYAAEGSTPFDLAAEAAQSCGDLATLAACNADLATASKGVAANAVADAVAAADRAARSVESWLGEAGQTGEAAVRDVRSALWKVSVAKGQLS